MDKSFLPINDANDETTFVSANVSSLSWTSLIVDAPASSTKKARRRILNVSAGHIKRGEIVAVLGGSGSGKTTFLNALAKRGLPLTHGIVTAAGAGNYVEQSDLFLEALSPREHLRFAARLRLSGHAGDYVSAHKAAESLLSRLRLSACADALIRSPIEGGGGLSGGERKRLSIATALIGDPSLLLVDEPTSGLDSAAAEAIVNLLRDLAHGPRNAAVLVTIHQPSSSMLDLFDRIILLRAGEMAFEGTVIEALDFFSSCGATCPQRHNPADFFIRTLAHAPDSEPESVLQEHERRADAIVTAWATAAASRNIIIADKQHTILSRYSRLFNFLCPPSRHHRDRPFGRVFTVLCARSMLATSRDPILIYTRTAQTLILALLAGSVYWQLKNDQEGVLNKNGAAFFVIINQALASIVGVLQTFPIERAAIARELEAGDFNVSTYFAAKTLASLPFEFVFPIVFATITFFMMRLHETVTLAILGQFVGIVALSASVSTSMGYFISALAPTVAVALALAPVVLLPFILFAGFLLNFNSISAAFKPLEVLSLFKYAFSALMKIIWGDVTSIDCGGSFVCPFPTGPAVLEFLSLDDSAATVITDAAALTALAIGWRCVALVTLWIRSPRPAYTL